MSTATDELKQLQTEVKAFLDAKEYFSNASAPTPRPIGIVLEDEKDIDARIGLLTTQLGGLAVLVTTPGGKTDFPNEYPAKYKATIALRVYEKPTTNRAANGIGEPGGKVAHAIFKLLHQASLPMGCLLLSMERSPGNDPRYATHDVFIETTIPLSADEPTRNS